MGSTNQPVSGTGPDATLNFSDPSTWVMILSIVAGVAAAVWPGHDLNPLVQALAPLAAAIVTTGVLFSKHHLAAALASTSALVPQLVAEEHTLASVISPPTTPLVAIHVATPIPVVVPATVAPIT